MIGLRVTTMMTAAAGSILTDSLARTIRTRFTVRNLKSGTWCHCSRIPALMQPCSVDRAAFLPSVAVHGNTKRVLATVSIPAALSPNLLIVYCSSLSSLIASGLFGGLSPQSIRSSAAEIGSTCRLQSARNNDLPDIECHKIRIFLCR